MPRSEREVERLVTEHQKLVHYMVNRYLRRYFVGAMEREDLVSWGLIGLVHAARAWDPDRCATFSTLACRAIERMIIRGVSREWKPEQSAATLSLDEAVSGDAGTSQERLVHLLASDQDVEQEILESERQAAVRSAMAGLPPPERRLLERRFYQGIPLASMAAELGVSRQRL